PGSTGRDARHAAPSLIRPGVVGRGRSSRWLTSVGTPAPPARTIPCHHKALTPARSNGGPRRSPAEALRREAKLPASLSTSAHPPGLACCPQVRRPPPYDHDCPTRRLRLPSQGSSPRGASRGQPVRRAPGQGARRRSCAVTGAARRLRLAPTRLRSEEHTSELQSRE